MAKSSSMSSVIVKLPAARSVAFSNSFSTAEYLLVTRICSRQYRQRSGDGMAGRPQALAALRSGDGVKREPRTSGGRGLVGERERQAGVGCLGAAL